MLYDRPYCINQLKESRSENILRRMETRFEKYDLVIVETSWIISFDKEESEPLFTHFSLRASRKLAIIITNLSLERWDEIF